MTREQKAEFEGFLNRLMKNGLTEEDIIKGVLQVNDRFGNLTFDDLKLIIDCLDSLSEKQLGAITGISLKNCDLKPEDPKDFFKNLPKELSLRYINLSGAGNDVKGTVEDSIAALKNPLDLEQLYLNDLKLIAEDWIDTLHTLSTKCPNLKVLSLRGNVFPTKGKFAEAKRICLKRAEATAFIPLYSVQVLTLESIQNHGNTVGNIDELIEFLKLFPNLRRLSLAGNSLTAEQITHLLANLEHPERLEELYIHGNSFKDEKASTMAKLLWQLTTCKELRCLRIWKCDMNDNAMKTLFEIADVFPEDMVIAPVSFNFHGIKGEKFLRRLGLPVKKYQKRVETMFPKAKKHRGNLTKTNTSMFASMKSTMTRSNKTKSTRQRGRSRYSSLASTESILSRLMRPSTQQIKGLTEKNTKKNYNKAKIIISLFYVEAALEKKYLATYNAIKEDLKKKLLESGFGAADNLLLQRYTLENCEDLMELLRSSVEAAINSQGPKQDPKELIPLITKEWECNVKKQLNGTLSSSQKSPVSSRRRGKRKKLPDPQLSQKGNSGL